MYVKLFASLYQGTLRGHAHEILVFTNLLAHCDKEGHVDKHFRAIAEEVGLTQAEVEKAIVVLESPDPESRSPELNGVRIVRIDEHRAWGWQIVNYSKYRQIRSEDDRRAQNRAAQAAWRERSKQRKPPSAAVSRDKPQSAQGEGEGYEEGEERAQAITSVKSSCVPPAPRKPTFQPPTIEEVKLQSAKIGLSDEQAEMFWHHYEANGWTCGRAKMRSWPSAMTKWKLNQGNYGTGKHPKLGAAGPKGFDRNAGTLNEGKATKYANSRNILRPGSDAGLADRLDG